MFVFRCTADSDSTVFKSSDPLRRKRCCAQNRVRRIRSQSLQLELEVLRPVRRGEGVMPPIESRGPHFSFTELDPAWRPPGGRHHLPG